MKSAFSLAGVFWMYACVVTIGGLYVKSFVPETKV
jgi:hypothetical protein